MPVSVRQFRLFHFALISLSRKGSSGCLLWSAREASDFYHFPSVIRAERRSPRLARIDGLHDRGDWKANGREIAAEKTRPGKSGHCPKSPAAHDWLRAANRAMCVSSGRQIARLKEDHI